MLKLIPLALVAATVATGVIVVKKVSAENAANDLRASRNSLCQRNLLSSLKYLM